MPQILSYDLARALHLIAVIAWMAAMLMLPRLYAYQTGAAPGGELEAKMIAASKSLRMVILNPSMIATWILGLYLLFAFHTPTGVAPWLWAKLALVTALSALHGFMVGEGKKLEKGVRRRSERFWRILNEAPFLIAIVAVLLVVLQPSFG